MVAIQTLGSTLNENVLPALESNQSELQVSKKKKKSELQSLIERRRGILVRSLPLIATQFSGVVKDNSTKTRVSCVNIPPPPQLLSLTGGLTR